jgi:hypothetical protein
MGDTFPERHSVALSFGWAALLLVTFAPAAVRYFSKNASASKG